MNVKVTTEQAMKAWGGGLEVWLCSFFNLGARWGWVVNAALPPGKRPITHSTGGLVGPRASLDRCVKSHLHLGSIPGPCSPL